MKDASPSAAHPIRLADYRPYPFRIDAVHLTFTLAQTATRVRARLQITPLAEAEDLDLFGEGLTLHSITLNGAPVDHLPLDDSFPPYAKGIRIDWADLPTAPFTLETEVEIDPQGNTALEGLYMSNGMYCTQCEAEGFRKITYYPDRPDVMAPFTVRILSDLPVLLSNGNPTASGPGWAEWHDPHPKPAYLFALVAGDLVAHCDHFTTASGAPVDLNIWVRAGDEGKCAYAMDALKRSMRWDETEYGREYDLSVFNIVAVDDFNMGAMENKGLNIFNSKYVLASPETATDRDYAFIEAIVAHEYFHNWTGNRITCRDWFQLCLKEGLTVFRDQQFSGDMRSKSVKRIEDVLQLRARQFREDAGPLAHNVRPDSYIEINNFYTATVYEKGAEIIGMLRTYLGPERYRDGCALYFDRHDGQACTIEDWLACFEEVANQDLSQFKRWYSQAGTPQVGAEWWREGDILHLALTQRVPPTPDQPMKEPARIPLVMGLLAGDGREILPSTLVDLDRPSLALRFDLGALAGGAPPAHVVPSLLRGFSAPVALSAPLSAADRLVLLAHDTDPFNRWEAGRVLARQTLLAMLTDGAAPDSAYLGALGAVMVDATLDPAFRALALALPSEDDMAQACVDAGLVPDPTAIHHARADLSRAMAATHRDTLDRLIRGMGTDQAYSPDADQAGKRALRNTCIGLLTRVEGPDRAQDLFEAATNMTDQFEALQILLRDGHAAAAGAFFAQWQGDRLVMDKWFMVQVAQAAPAEAVALATRLCGHPLFDWKNPNRFRSLVSGLTAGNPAGFHDPSGAGYRFLSDWLIRLDAINPQTAARMSTAFETWARYDADRQGLIQAELARIAAAPGLSRDLSEMVARMRG